MKAKMQAYYDMGKCYSQTKDYENSIKCYKKILEISWRTDDIGWEVRAYE